MDCSNRQIFQCVIPFLEGADVVALTSVCRQAREEYQSVIKNLFMQAFGAQKEDKALEPSTMRRLLRSTHFPKPDVNHNIYEASKGWMKSFVGLKTSRDNEVLEEYNRKIDTLENIQALSIQQLRNQMHAFYHTDQQLRDYSKLDQSWGLKKVKFPVREGIEEMPRKIFAKMGHFELDGEGYDVVASHRFSVVNKKVVNDEVPVFQTMPWTWVRIVKESTLNENNHNFRVQIGRREKNGEKIVFEVGCGEFNSPVVDDNERHLIIDGLEFRDGTSVLQGSDRSLDQKLTQIIIEMAKQNERIQDVKVSSNHDDLPVLVAGDFSCNGRTNKWMIEELSKFRSREGNKLFPPYEDYSGWNCSISTDAFQDENVILSQGNAESWDEIIKKHPILFSGAGVLPEYWAQKPNIES